MQLDIMKLNDIEEEIRSAVAWLQVTSSRRARGRDHERMVATAALCQLLSLQAEFRKFLTRTVVFYFNVTLPSLATHCRQQLFNPSC